MTMVANPRMIQNRVGISFEPVREMGDVESGYYGKGAMDDYGGWPSRIGQIRRGRMGVQFIPVMKGVNLGLIKIPEAPPAVMIGVGAVLAGAASLASYAAFDSIGRQPSDWLKIGLGVGGTIAVFAGFVGSMAVITGISKAVSPTLAPVAPQVQRMSPGTDF